MRDGPLWPTFDRDCKGAPLHAGKSWEPCANGARLGGVPSELDGCIKRFCPAMSNIYRIKLLPHADQYSCMGKSFRMSKSSMTEVESCLTCSNINRPCDGNHPVCETCQREGDILCRWPTPYGMRLERDRIQRSSSSPRPPFAWLQDSPEARLFFATQTTRRMFKVDPDLQEIFSSVDPQSEAGELQIQAALAILSTNLQDYSARWVGTGLARYNDAVATVLSRLPACSENQSWKGLGIAISLINVFERHDHNFPRRYIHLKGLRTMIDESPSCGSQPLAISCQVIKSAIFYTAIGSTFSYSEVALDLPDSYISDLGYRLFENPGHGCQTLDTISGVPLVIFEVIVRVAHARHISGGAQPTPEARHRLEQIKQVLENDNNLIAEFQVPATTISHWAKLKQLFRVACVILLAKVINPSLRSGQVRETVTSILPILRTINIEEQAPAVAWPLLVLFFAAEREEREYIRGLLEQHLNFFNMQRHRQMIEFLQQLERNQEEAANDDAIFDVLLRGDVDEITLL